MEISEEALGAGEAEEDDEAEAEGGANDGADETVVCDRTAVVLEVTELGVDEPLPLAFAPPWQLLA